MHSGPKIITDGLVFGYDTSYGVDTNTNSYRYYKGRPTSNNINGGGNRANAITAPFIGNHAGCNAGGVLESYENRPHVYRYYCTNNTGYAMINQHSSMVNTAGTRYTYSFDFKILSGPENTLTPSAIYGNDYKSPTSAGTGTDVVDTYVQLDDGWTRFIRTYISSYTGYNYFRTNCQTYDTTNFNILFDNFQIEEGYPSPFTDGFTIGNRSSLDCIVDLVGNSFLDTSAVSFDSSGQPTFDGTGDYIDVTSISSFNLYHISFWAKPFETITPSYLGYFPQWITQDTTFHVAQGPWTGGATDETFHIWNKPEGSTMTHIRDTISNDWHNFVWNWNGSTYDCYIDGVQKTTYPRSNGHAGLITTDTSTLRIGGNFASYFYKGDMAAVRMYNRALTTQEIQQNFQAYKNRFNIS